MNEESICETFVESHCKYIYLLSFLFFTYFDKYINPKGGRKFNEEKKAVCHLRELRSLLSSGF